MFELYLNILSEQDGYILFPLPALAYAARLMYYHSINSSSIEYICLKSLDSTIYASR